jgi:hypothetical protein
MNMTLNVNNLMEIRKMGLQALKEVLGPVGMVRFMQQYENGYGDYTKEKYQHHDLSVQEIDDFLKETKKPNNFP